jgi:hypothetical protein
VTTRGEDDDKDELPNDDDEGQEGVEREPLFAPPGDDEYETVKFFAGLTELPKVFQPHAELNREYLKRKFAAFAVRFTGADKRTSGFEPYFFTERVMQASRLNRWVTNAAFKGSGPPGVFATVPGSLIAHFTIAAGEEPMRLGSHTEYPSVAGARAVARLIGYTGHEEALLEAVRPLGKNAVKSLLKTLDDSAQLGLTVNWLSREGQYARVTPKQAERGLETLNIVPVIVRRPPIVIVGSIDRPDKGHGRVRMQPLQGGAMMLHYEPNLQETIRQAWGKFIIGTMIVEEPENPSLPRAPQRVRSLTRISRIFDTEEELLRRI